MERGAILITGIAGGLARRVAFTLRAAGHDVVGVDYRTVPALPAGLAGMPVYRASYEKTAIEEVFRRHAPTTVLHLGREGNLQKRVAMRFNVNVLGSRKIFELAASHGARTLVVLSTFHIYGAHPHNHVPLSEDDPVRAGYDFPEIADAIELDAMAREWVWRRPELRTVVLRPTNVVGPNVQNTMSTFLRMARVPHLAGFDPMVQFVHEDDLAAAVIAAARGAERGVFNVGGPAVLPWSAALDLVGARSFPLPSSLVSLYLRQFSSFPAYLVNFYKYPCVITDAPFRRAFGWAPAIDIRATLKSTVAAARRARGAEA